MQASQLFLCSATFRTEFSVLATEETGSDAHLYITGALRAGEAVLWGCTVANVRADNRSQGVGLETPKPLGRKMDANESFNQHRRGSVKTGPH